MSTKKLLKRLVGEMVDGGLKLSEAMKEFEKRYILTCMNHANGNCNKASKLLGVHRNTLSQKLARYRKKPKRSK